MLKYVSGKSMGEEIKGWLVGMEPQNIGIWLGVSLIVEQRIAVLIKEIRELLGRIPLKT